MNRWLPGAPPYGGQVTVGELLNHTSGIPEYLDKIAELYATGYGLGVIELRTPCGPAIVLTVTLDSPAALQEQESLITRPLCR